MISLNVDNLLLRGSRLRNTDYVLGVAIYQGHDTKIMQNSA
jgi:magnesium-transporting ATPase (P-type)